MVGKIVAGQKTERLVKLNQENNKKPAIESSPESDVLWHHIRPQDVSIGRPLVDGVDELVVVRHDVAPQRVGLLPEVEVFALPLAVPDEGAVLAAVGVLLDRDQETLVELKVRRK